MTHNVGVAYRRWLPLCWMVPEAGVAPTGPVPCGDYLAIWKLNVINKLTIDSISVSYPMCKTNNNTCI